MTSPLRGQARYQVTDYGTAELDRELRALSTGDALLSGVEGVARHVGRLHAAGHLSLGAFDAVVAVAVTAGGQRSVVEPIAIRAWNTGVADPPDPEMPAAPLRAPGRKPRAPRDPNRRKEARN